MPINYRKSLRLLFERIEKIAKIYLNLTKKSEYQSKVIAVKGEQLKRL